MNSVNAAPHEPVTVTTRVTERFRMPPPEPPNLRRFDNLQADLQTVKAELEKPALASIEAFKTEIEKVKGWIRKTTNGCH